MTIGQRAIVQLILLMGQEVVVDLMVVIMSIQMDLSMFPRRIRIEPLCYGINGEGLIYLETINSGFRNCRNMYL